MSNEEKVTPSVADEKSLKISKKRLSWSAWFSIVILVLVLVWLGFAAYQIWWFKKQAMTSWQQAKEQVQQLSQMQVQQEENITANQMAIAQLSSFAGQQQWHIQQASYLIQLANAHLFLQQDVSASLILLQAASRDLKGVQSLSWQAVSQALVKAIQSLQSQINVDVLQVYAQLQSASLKVSVLSLPSKLQVNTTDTAEQATEPQSKWKMALNASWQVIRQVLVIRYHDNTVQPILTDDEQQLVRLHLSLLFMQAEWAALQHQPDTYQTAILAAQAWIKHYFLNNNPVTQDLLQTLSDLSKQKVSYQLSAVRVLSQALLQAAGQTTSKEGQ